MQLIPVPSLEHISLVKAAVTIWKEDHIRHLVADFSSLALYDFEVREEWENVEKEVIKNASTLDYPKILKEKLLNYIRAIGGELLKWIKHHEKYLYNPTCSKRILGKIAWTCAGKIDNKETTKFVVHEEDINISKRFILACFNCLEKDILELWNKLTTLEREYFISADRNLFVQNQQLISYWAFHASENLITLQDIDFYMFVDSAMFYNIQGVKYFWSRFSSVPTFQRRSLLPIVTDMFQYRFDFISQTCKDFEYGASEVLCFLLSKMTPEEKFEAMKRFPTEILKCYLEWPLQSMFTDISKLIFPWLSEFNFDTLLFNIISYINTTKLQNYDYQALLGEFWQQSPSRCKKYIINKHSSYLYSNLLLADDRCNIRLILQAASIEERDKIIFKHLSALEDPIYEGKFDVLRFFILQCIFSKERLLDFKLECDEYFTGLQKFHVNHIEKCQAFFKLIDDIIIGFKEDPEDIEQNPPKRLCI